ncbi:hypothetical protein EGW08_016567 [Elysia chlorotica]|uniref:CUB domain-containing protein n=1 Tax=Elysia chlorotica TaxID=188477 RepID=A0A433T2A3_ELYCH|nr:hypothetical protein EGW08_016567 [Elysia chlorotica]
MASLKVVFVALLMMNSTYAAQVAKGMYSMNTNSDCVWIGKLDVPRDQTTFLNGKAAIGSTRGDATTCRLQFTPETSGDTLEVSLSSTSRINDCRTSLTISMSPGGQYELGCQSNAVDFPTFEAQNGVATIQFVRPDVSVTNYYFQVHVKASRTIDKEPPGGGASSSDVGMIVGIIAGVVVFIVIFCVVCICCWRKRQESLQEKRQFINVGAAQVEGVKVAGVENGVYTQGVHPESPGSNRRLLGRKDLSSEDGGSSVDGLGRSALDRFGPAPSRRRQNVGPNEGEAGRKRSAFQVESEVDDRQPVPQPRDGGLRRGGPSQDYQDVRGQGGNKGSTGSPLLSDLRSNPKFRRSFHENEADANERTRRLSVDSQDSKDYNNKTTRRPSLPRVPRSPSRSPSPQRRGEKIAAIYRARPSSSVDAARLDSDRSDETPPIQEQDSRGTRHVLRPDRDRRGQPKRADISNDDDDNHDRIRRQEQKRRDREDEERQRRRRREEEEDEREEEERRRKQEKKRKEEERRRREEEEELEEEKRRRKEEKKKEEDQRKRRAAKESDGSEYEGRFKKSASGRRSKGKGQRMGRSRSTGNALEELDDRHQRSRSKSPGSVRSLNFLEGDEDDTDLDSNYLPFRRAGSKTSLYTSRSSLYGRRRKNSLGETVSVSSRTALDDTDSRMGDFDHMRMSQKELRRLFKSTGELEMSSESAQVVREVGTSTRKGGSATVYGRKTQAKGRHGKRYSRGTQTPQSRGGRERRDSVGSAKSGRSTGSRHKLKSRSRSRESLGDRRSRSRSRNLTDEDEEVSDGSSDGNSRKSGHSSHRPRKSHRSTRDYSSDDDKGDNIADDQSVAPSIIAPASMHNAAVPQPYGQYPVMAAPGYPQMVYQPIVAPGGPPVPVAPPGMVYQMAAPSAVQPQKPPIAPKPKPKPQPGASRWDELVNLTDGMKQRRRQMGESVTEDGTESVLSSMWSQPTYNPQHHQHQPVGQFHAPPSYTTAQHLGGHNASYSSNYADSSVVGLTPPRNTRMDSYSPSESNV